MTPKEQLEKLQSEMNSLKVQLRITQWCLAALAIGFALLFALSGRSGPPAYLPLINTSELVLRDAEGKERATLKCSRSGQPYFELKGVWGAKVGLGFSAEKPFDVASIGIKDANGQSRISLFSALKYGGASIDIGDENGRGVVSLHNDPFVSS
jgi:hypothetical protein